MPKWKTKTREELFWEKVQITESCWLWMAAKDKDGYGQFKVDGRQLKAHRCAWF